MYDALCPFHARCTARSCCALRLRFRSALHVAAHQLTSTPRCQSKSWGARTLPDTMGGAMGQ